MIVAIKDELMRIKEISKGHYILAAFSAMVIGMIAAITSPLDLTAVSVIYWIPLTLTPFLPTLFFYILVQKPKRSVFWFVRWLYYIGAPLSVMYLSTVLFNPAKAEYYSEKFFIRFMPGWMAIWWLGTFLMYLLMRGAEYAVKTGYERGTFPARLIFALTVMFTPQKRIYEKKREGRAKWITVLVCVLLVAAAVLIGSITLFLNSVYSNMEFEAILFTMRFAAGGLAIEDLIAGTAIFLLFATVTGYICFHMIKCFRNDILVVEDTNKDHKYTLVMNGRKRAALVLISLILMGGCFALFSAQTNFGHYVSVKHRKSTIYEKYYVEPKESTLCFPEKKRNLIYIYLESMENTYASIEDGGNQYMNYMPELTELVSESDCVNFSNTNLLGGASVFVPSITFTMGSTVSQTSGISLNTELFPLNAAKEFPSVTRLEDIMHDNGYNQLYIEGSKGEFSMYDKYVGRYEDSKIFDRTTAVENGYIAEDEDCIWKWGIEDWKLFEITKELITDMSQEDKPFFVTMYTMDTHSFECGHCCRYCDSSIRSDYLGAVDCSSKLTYEFVNWVRQQPFYENTTIILVGDHLGNEKTTKVAIDDDYVRTTYNCFVNPVKKPVNTQNRIFSSLDMFPTTLSAIGVEIKGDRLGLGTDLFSETKTLSEELGEAEYKEQLERDCEY